MGEASTLWSRHWQTLEGRARYAKNRLYRPSSPVTRSATTISFSRARFIVRGLFSGVVMVVDVLQSFIHSRISARCHQDPNGWGEAELLVNSVLACSAQNKYGELGACVLRFSLEESNVHNYLFMVNGMNTGGKGLANNSSELLSCLS